MRRCCLFFLCSCCCECDPDAERDNMRKARVRARRVAKKQEVEARARVEARKAADAAARDGVTTWEEGGGEAATRAALFGRPAAPERKGTAYQIGKGLAGEFGRGGSWEGGRGLLPPAFNTLILPPPPPQTPTGRPCTLKPTPKRKPLTASGTRWPTCGGWEGTCRLSWRAKSRQSTGWGTTLNARGTTYCTCPRARPKGLASRKCGVSCLGEKGGQRGGLTKKKKHRHSHTPPSHRSHHRVRGGGHVRRGGAGGSQGGGQEPGVVSEWGSFFFFFFFSVFLLGGCVAPPNFSVTRFLCCYRLVRAAAVGGASKMLQT